jgi:hypothetical protein
MNTPLLYRDLWTRTGLTILLRSQGQAPRAKMTCYTYP